MPCGAPCIPLQGNSKGLEGLCHACARALLSSAVLLSLHWGFEGLWGLELGVGVLHVWQGGHWLSARKPAAVLLGVPHSAACVGCTALEDQLHAVWKHLGVWGVADCAESVSC